MKDKELLFIPIAMYDGTTNCFELESISPTTLYNLVDTVVCSINEFELIGKKISYSLSRVYVNGRSFAGKRNNFSLKDVLVSLEFEGLISQEDLKYLRDHGYEGYGERKIFKVKEDSYERLG